MATGVPTAPASVFHAGRADAIRQVRCVLSALASPPAVLDLTRGGVLLDVASPLRIGSHHVCQFSVGDQSVRLPARVTHTRSLRGGGGAASLQVGLAFRLTSRRDDAALERLARLIGGLR